MAYMALRLAGPALHRAGALAVREEVVLNSLGRFTTLLGREFGPPEIWSSASLQSKALPPICLPATPPICSPASFPEAQPPVSSPAVPSPVSSPAVPSPEGPSLRRCFPEVTSSTQVQAPGRPPEFPGTTPVPAPGCPPEFPGATPAQTPTSSPDRLAPYGGQATTLGEGGFSPRELAVGGGGTVTACHGLTSPNHNQYPVLYLPYNKRSLYDSFQCFPPFPACLRFPVSPVASPVLRGFTSGSPVSAYLQ
ncbi:proline-rich protein 36-like isoform X2 [Siniperca chuatsi]|uniref:proline-rich protein 36-like isoform X2 n=1 Tax=Siniperca chuatsi TaxID=119488 RepID=UPI001CE16FE3|nr:proline-rich protein 36-like isoform X2 [Siniperca chuatsi]